MKEEMGGGILVVNQVAKHCMMCKTYNLYIELQALAFHLTSSSKYCCKNSYVVVPLLCGEINSRWASNSSVEGHLSYSTYKVGLKLSLNTLKTSENPKEQSPSDIYMVKLELPFSSEIRKDK